MEGLRTHLALQGLASMLIHDVLVLLARCFLLLGFLQGHEGMQYIFNQLLADVQVDRRLEASVELRLMYILFDREPQMGALQKGLPDIEAIVVVADHHLDVGVSAETFEPILQSQRAFLHVHLQNRIEDIFVIIDDHHMDPRQVHCSPELHATVALLVTVGHIPDDQVIFIRVCVFHGIGSLGFTGRSDILDTLVIIVVPVKSRSFMFCGLVILLISSLFSWS